MATRPPRDNTLRLLHALDRARAPLPTAALARGVRGRKSAANAAYLLLRELEGMGLVRRVSPPKAVARGRGKPGHWWTLTRICARGDCGQELPFTVRRSA